MLPAVELYNDDDNTRRIKLTPPQTAFTLSKAQFPLFLGGYGAGKSLAMGLNILMDLDLGPKVKIGAYAPTYDLLKLITIPYLEELLEDAGEEYDLNKTDKIFYLSDKRQIICRSMDNPARIVGYQTLRAHADELDTLPMVQAEKVWNKIIARNRQVIQNKATCKNFKNRVSAYTTPEGFLFAYDRWVKRKEPGYEIYKAPTSTNPHLPDDYIDNLLKTYSLELVQAYLDAEFVNMQSGSVYPGFGTDASGRYLNHTDEVVQRGDHLHVGMDFNVHKMAAGIHVIRAGNPYAVDEITNGVDTPQVCQLLKEKYKDKGHLITIYPDSSGDSKSAKDASKSDLTIIKSYGFNVKAKNKNPPIKDRIKSVNASICNSEGERRYKVNTNMCPGITDSLAKQIYDTNGMPDKKAGFDHHSDEVGYFIHYNWPVVKQQAKTKTIRVLGR